MALKCSECRSGDCSAVGGDLVSCFACGATCEKVPHGQSPDNPEDTRVEVSDGAEVTVEAEASDEADDDVTD